MVASSLKLTLLYAFGAIAVVGACQFFVVLELVTKLVLLLLPIDLMIILCHLQV